MILLTVLKQLSTAGAMLSPPNGADSFISSGIYQIQNQSLINWSIMAFRSYIIVVF